MRIKEFEKLKKQFEPKKIIFFHCTGLIYLTNKQLDAILELKNKEVRKWKKI